MSEEQEKPALVISNRTYDVLKRLVQVVLPAFSAAYFGLASIWGLPAAEQVVGTVAVITTFLGVVLGISTNQYYGSDVAYDGSVLVETNESGTKVFSLLLNEDPEELEHKDSILFKVDQDRTD